MSTADQHNTVSEEEKSAVQPAAGATPVPAIAALLSAGPDGGSKKPLPAIVWPLLALAALLLFNLCFTKGFFSITMNNGHLYGSLIDVLNRGAPVMLLSMGMTLVIATGGIDISVGAVMAIVGAIAACLLARPDYSFISGFNVHDSAAAVILICLAVAALLGAWNGLLVAIVDIQPIIATLILMVAGRGIAQLITHGQIPGFTNSNFACIGRGFLFYLPLKITVAIVATILIAWVVRATALGLFIESVGNNPISSRFAGVNATVVKMVVYTICGLFAGIAGLIATADIGVADVNSMGLYLELDAILAVAIGGTSLNGGRFFLAGSLVGALLIQTLTTTILTLGVNPPVTLMVKAGIVIAVCLLQSEKFLGMARKLTKGKAAS